MIDDQLDDLEELRGDLPLAVNDLKNQIESIKELNKSKENEKAESFETIKANEDEIERMTENLKKYKSQLYQVRNNKEYDALTKEIDNTEENIEKLEEENMALEDLIQKLKIEIDEVAPQLVLLKDELKNKEEELKMIIKANEREEIKLQDQREQVSAKVKKSDYNTYMRIRKACSGKAMATINRSACSACHAVVPPQRQIEIKQNKRLFTCESCGRLLVSPDIADTVKTSLK
jgi:predicted  nucleic acid-binding Zn-ribbon protein